MPTKPGLPAAFADLVDGRLLGAKCVGHHRLFDADLDNMHESTEQRSARHAQAARICATCPVQAGCAAVATEAGRHAEGVWAGRIPAPRPLGRPRKDLSA